MTGLTLTIRIQFVSGLSVPCRGHGEINHVCSGCFGTNRIIDNWHRCLPVMWRKKKKIFRSMIKNTFLWIVNFYFIDPQNYLSIMRTFLNRMKNETLNEIKTSLKHLWQWTILLSVFFQHPLVLIPKRKCLVGACRIGCGESGTPLTINLYTMKQSAWRTWISCSDGVFHVRHSCLCSAM